MTDASVWIDRLELQPHPEGGFYRETYRCAGTIERCCMGDDYEGPRAFSTAIYFLLDGKQVSRFHRLRSDEIWHYYAGCALHLHLIEPGGAYERRRVGPDIVAGEAPQTVIPAGVWFGATVSDSRSFALLGCTVAPGFDFRDFELARHKELLGRFPQHRAVIDVLAR